MRTLPEIVAVLKSLQDLVDDGSMDFRLFEEYVEVVIMDGRYTAYGDTVCEAVANVIYVCSKTDCAQRGLLPSSDP